MQIIYSPLPKWRITYADFNKYQALSKLFKMRLNTKSFTLAGYASLGDLFDAYRRDQALSSCTAHLRHVYAPSFLILHDEEITLARVGVSCSEVVELVKHCLRRDVLGLKPEVIVRDVCRAM